MRILALISLIVAVACMSAGTATAVGQDHLSQAPTPQFAEDVPRLLPLTRPEPAATTAPASSGGLHVHALAVIAALYWLVLGGVALRRARRVAALAW